MAKGRELIARFKPGDNLPVYATGANIAAGRFVTIRGTTEGVWEVGSQASGSEVG